MKTVLKVFFFLITTLAVAWCQFVAPSGTNGFNMWTSWKNVFNRNYNPFEEPMRMLNFFQTHKMVNQNNQQYNQQLKPYSMGHNEFSDMSDEEFKIKMMGLKNEQNCADSLIYQPPDNPNVPDNIDYRDYGYVTPVKSQEACSACWAFVAIAALEGQHKRITGNLVTLSEQNLIDCSGDQDNFGCNGGIMCRAYEYAATTPGVATEASYPFTGSMNDGQCHYDQSQVGSPVGGYLQLPKGDENTLKVAVGLIGPVAAGFDGSPTNFRFYKGGIFSDPTCDSEALTHALTIIGYGTENNTDYWLVKNSWGPSWGDNGYGKIIRNYNNHCGIASRAVFPVLNKNSDGSPKLDGPAAT